MEIEQTEVTTINTGASNPNVTTVSSKAKKRGYSVHPLDQLVESRKKKVRVKHDDGTVHVSVRDIPYKVPRYERYEPVVNLGKTYPFGSKRQGFEND